MESQGITVIYSSDIEEYVQNANVDYANNWLERGFVIRGAGVSSC
ncbi:MAG TPA: hypothetical protein VFD03_07835 [Clostridia bacterium]|nr:hypothetical protein [Clostridia bacterium]